MIQFFAACLLLATISSLGDAQPAPTEAKGHADLIHTIAFSPDGKTFATGGFDKEIKLWDYANGKIKETKTLSGHTDPVYCVVFFPDGKRLASSSHDKSIRIWNLADGKTLQQLKGHSDIVDTIAISPDGKLIASGSGGPDKSVRLWNPDDGKEIKNLGTHGATVHSVAFSPNGKLLASGGADNIIKIWDVPGQKELLQLKGHEMGVTGVVFVDDKTLVSISQDRTLRVWDLDAKDPTPKIDPKDVKKEEPKKDVAKKDDPKKESKDLPKKAGKDFHEVKKFGPTVDDLYALAYSKEAKAILTAGYAGNISLWDLNDPKPKFTTKLKSLAYCAAFSPDGKAALSGHLDGVVRVTPLK